MKTKKPLIIAEIGVNHFDIAKLFDISPIDAAKKMIFEAKINGADVAKFQTYKAEKIAAKFSPSYWDTSEEKTKSQIDLLKNSIRLVKMNFKNYQIIAMKLILSLCQQVLILKVLLI